MFSSFCSPRRVSLIRPSAVNMSGIFLKVLGEGKMEKPYHLCSNMFARVCHKVFKMHVLRCAHNLLHTIRSERCAFFKEGVHPSAAGPTARFVKMLNDDVQEGPGGTLAY